MKRLLALAALVVAVPALAEDVGGEAALKADPKAMAAKMSERMKLTLKLSDSQAAKVSAILQKSVPERAELERKLREQERRMHEQIRALLDDEQKERFDMMRVARHGMMGRGGLKMRAKRGFGMHGMDGAQRQGGQDMQPSGSDEEGPGGYDEASQQSPMTVPSPQGGANPY